MICLILLAAFAACKKESTNPEFEDKPVIAAYLTVGDTARLNISRLTPFASNSQFSSDNINALQVFINTNNTSYQLQSRGNGNYVASNPFLKIDSSSTYNLSLVFNGKNVTASTTIPTKPKGYTQSATSFSMTQITATTTTFPTFPGPIKLTWINSDNSYYLVVVENIEVSPEAINLKTDLPTRIFKNTPLQTNTYDIRANQFHYFGNHRLILYHINADYAALYTNNNNSSNNLTNSQTSVNNGAGIFTGLNADTLYVKVLKY